MSLAHMISRVVNAMQVANRQKEEAKKRGELDEGCGAKRDGWKQGELFSEVYSLWSLRPH